MNRRDGSRNGDRRRSGSRDRRSTSQDRGWSPSAPAPPKPHDQGRGTRYNSPHGGKRPCKFFAQGRCTAGSKCKWSHDIPPSAPAQTGKGDQKGKSGGRSSSRGRSGSQGEGRPKSSDRGRRRNNSKKEKKKKGNKPRSRSSSKPRSNTPNKGRRSRSNTPKKNGQRRRKKGNKKRPAPRIMYMCKPEWLSDGIFDYAPCPSEQEHSDSEDEMPPLEYYCRRPEAGHAAPTGCVTAEGDDNGSGIHTDVYQQLTTELECTNIRDFPPAAPALMLSESTDPTARPEPRTRRKYDHEADSSDDDRNPEKRARGSASSSSFQ